jgi:Rieske Fe-S protein
MSDTAGMASRRTVVAAVGVAGLATTLAACGGSDSSDSKKSDDASKPSAGGPQDLGSASDIPVGGGKVFKDEKVVVTQPKKGEYEAFSAICTHMGCTVGSVSGGTINCPCHGSKYHVADGTVASGPAPKPLPKMKVAVEGGSLKVS